MKKVLAASTICIEEKMMRWAVRVAGALALCFTISPGFAQDQCEARRALACEMATFYADGVAGRLPEDVESFGIRFKVVSVTASGAKLVVNVKTLKNNLRLERQLASDGISLSELRLLVEGEILDGVCRSPEGPAFLQAGGQMEANISTADRQPLMSIAIQSCDGA